MATTTPIEPGAIATQAGADKLRGELLSAHEVRCANLWHALASVYADGAAEIEVGVAFDADRQVWASSAFFYSFEAVTAALRAYEATGVLPEE
ncbi:MAG: hypothetical protein H7Y32_07365 [Chloroflexales bacterium]|nr:hypothetical protein [Chloroflexales bacterium]